MRRSTPLNDDLLDLAKWNTNINVIVRLLRPYHYLEVFLQEDTNAVFIRVDRSLGTLNGESLGKAYERA